VCFTIPLFRETFLAPANSSSSEVPWHENNRLKQKHVFICQATGCAACQWEMGNKSLFEQELPHSLIFEKRYFPGVQQGKEGWSLYFRRSVSERKTGDPPQERHPPRASGVFVRFWRAYSHVALAHPSLHPCGT